MTGLENSTVLSHNKTMNPLPCKNVLKTLFIALALMSTVVSYEAAAQQIKIKKTKGLQAIIESSVPLEEGQVYDLATAPIAQNVDYRATGFKSRQHSVSFGGSLLGVRGTDYQRNSISLQGRYGWNFTSNEFGVLAQFTSEDLGAGATNEFTGGGYFDYDLVPNRDPKNMVYGLVGILTFGSRQFPAASGGGSATTMDANAGGFFSWFINSSTTALRVEGFFDYEQISTTAQQTNVTGFGSRALLVFYY